jgi:hypothetical protein
MYYCHPERSERVLNYGKPRFFALLRMTTGLLFADEAKNNKAHTGRVRNSAHDVPMKQK